jgi:hypothetical protein
VSYHVDISKPDAIDKPVSLWSKPEFMEEVQNMHQLEALHVRCYKGEQLVAVLPVYEKRLLSYRVLKNPAGSYYQGLSILSGDKSLPARKLLDSLQITQSIAKALRDRYKKVQINLSPDSYDVRGFTWSGLSAKPLYTFVHQYQEDLQLLPDERKKVSQAEKEGYKFREQFDAEAFLRLFTAMNGRKNRHIGFSNRQFTQYLTGLHNKGFLRQFNLYREDVIVSSNMLLVDAKNAYTVFRATDNEALKTGASGLHSLKLLETLKSEFTMLDFCGANVPDVARFKAALGLQLMVFFQIQA